MPGFGAGGKKYIISVQDMETSTSSTAHTEDNTAPWWPLALLALVGIASGSYFWNQQTNAVASVNVSINAKALAPKPQLTSTAQRETEVPKPKESSLPSVVMAPTPHPEVQPVEVTKLPASSPRATDKTSSVHIPDKHKAVRKPETKHVASEASPLVETATPSYNANTTEGLLYARLVNPEAIDRKPINLDRLSFAPGEAEIDPEGDQQLSDIANLLQNFSNYRLIVFGYAESSEPNSITLGLARANTVIAALVKHGVPSASLQAQGHLRSAADKTNDSNANRRPSLYISSLD